MAGLEGTFLGDELSYQLRRWLIESGSVACCCHCLVPVLSMSCCYRCRYLVTTTGVVVSILSKFLLQCRLLLSHP